MLYLTERNSPESPSTRRALAAIEGYLFFGMMEEAACEFETITVEQQGVPGVLLARIRVLLHLHEWHRAAELAGIGRDVYPEENEFTVQQAFALHQMSKGSEAMEVLLSAPEWIRRTGILHYNLACYEARMGDLKTARQCIRAACEINAAFKKNARHDPDLQALWN